MGHQSVREGVDVHVETTAMLTPAEWSLLSTESQRESLGEPTQ